jgi:hypothetical protein
MKRSLLLLLLVFFMHLLAGNASAQSKWYVFLYGGQLTDGNLGETFAADINFVDSYLMAMGTARELARYKDWISVEAEGQFVQHFGIQDHQEVNLALVLRWLAFPWDCYLDTSFAWGDGISYATDIPEVETDRHHNESAHFMDYMMFELTFSLPQLPRWSLLARIHHRSGCFGLFEGVNGGGSNALCLGLKYNL